MKNKIKIKDLVGDLSYKEIKRKKWRTPRLWKNGTKLSFTDYIISEDGIVLRIGRVRGSFIGRRIKSGEDKRGYVGINLSFEKKRYTRIKMHRLIWETWRYKIPDKLQPNHKDGIKNNNDLDNLEIITPKENVQHAIELGLRKFSKGEKHYMFGKHHTKESKKKISKALIGRKFSKKTREKMRRAKAKLTYKEVEKIRLFSYFNEWTLQKIADRFKVSKGCINGIVQGYKWNPDHLTKEELMSQYV